MMLAEINVELTAPALPSSTCLADVRLTKASILSRLRLSASLSTVVYLQISRGEVCEKITSALAATN
jgi:hypothetical protein